MSTVFVVTLQDVIALSILGIFFGAMLIWLALTLIRQAFCKHKDTQENFRNLHTICRKCDKDLGFRK